MQWRGLQLHRGSRVSSTALKFAAVIGGFLWLSGRRTTPARPKKTPAADLPAEGCGLYPWLPQDVDAAIRSRTDAGERDAEALAHHAAQAVYANTPEGGLQTWPPPEGDARAHCILGRIRIRVNLVLAQLADDDADDDDPTPEPAPFDPMDSLAPLPGNCPPGYQYDEVLGCIEIPEPPDEFAPWNYDPDEPQPEPQPPAPEGEEDAWPDYPEPGPVDLDPWTDPGNYPTPGKFHQIGGSNSGVTLKAIARKALTTAFYLVLDDVDAADQLARRSENWRTYRQVINCCPYNHLLFGAPNLPGETGFYETPSGDSISLYPVHDHIAQRLANGETPERRVRDDNRKLPSGGKHAFLWLPPLDELALSEGRVEVKRDYWETGDWVMMPPPEVLTLGVSTSSETRIWGCDGWELDFFDNDPAGRTANGGRRLWFHPRTRLSLRRSG